MPIPISQLVPLNPFCFLGGGKAHCAPLAPCHVFMRQYTFYPMKLSRFAKKNKTRQKYQNFIRDRYKLGQLPLDQKKFQKSNIFLEESRYPSNLNPFEHGKSFHNKWFPKRIGTPTFPTPRYAQIGPGQLALKDSWGINNKESKTQSMDRKIRIFVLSYNRWIYISIWKVSLCLVRAMWRGGENVQSFQLWPFQLAQCKVATICDLL